MIQRDQIISQIFLTNRENEILEFVAVGDSAKEAAHRLSIAPRTVERHIENIRLKMHAKNRAHMVMCAILFDVLKVNTPDPTVGLIASNPPPVSSTYDPAQLDLNLNLN